MLEVKHLRKEYKTKNGVTTKALDDVSLTFAETGMVFILGKSGSGKSTLLNICGGLDRADSGEIIIKGKSSNDFSGQDFDSYRNTYVGFVFQEYNILDEFTVEENIALALELQNKKRDKTVIDKILADVDMTSFASRKPNTLSGGQKQRVAIARALVKEPEIIMADEPTGALDSKTGQQVFDTLKKLSQTKLVLVISHDRDFAEQYGDRIIELKDGKVISDQMRAEEGDNSKNVRFFGSDTVCVARGSELTDDDLQSIKKFLNKAGGAAVISTSRERINDMKQDLPEMSVGAFEDVEEQPQSKSYPQQKLIRSHLPARHAIRMGGSSLKTKPVRLFFTILLSVIAFILFGLASTLMLFDDKSVTKETLNNSGDGQIVISKAYWQTVKSYNGDKLEYEDEVKTATDYTYDEFKAVREKYPGALAGIDMSVSLDISMTDTARQFYSSGIDGFIIDDPSLTYVFGTAPKALDEVAISDFTFDGLKTQNTKFAVNKLDEKGNEERVELEVKSASDIIYSESNPVFAEVNGANYKITGIYAGMGIPSEYDELKTAADQNRSFSDMTTQYMWMQTRQNGLYARIAVIEEFAKLLASMPSQENDFDYSKYFDYSMAYVQIGVTSEDGQLHGESAGMFAKYEKTDERTPLTLYGFDGKALASLDSGSVGMRYNKVAYILYEMLNSSYWNLYGEVESAMNDAWNEASDLYDQTHVYPSREEYSSDDAFYAALNKYYEEKESVAYEARIEASGKLKSYLTYELRVRNETKSEFKANNPEPSVRYSEEWNEWNDRLIDAINKAWEVKEPKEALYNVYYGVVSDRQTVFEIIKAGHEFAVDWGVLNKLKMQSNFDGSEAFVTISGMYFEGNRWSEAMYLSNDLYDMFFVKHDYGNDWHTEYESKYEPPENAFISSIYIAKSGNTVDELVDMTYEHGDDDSTTMIKNSVMQQLDMIIEMADTLATAFLIAGLVLALFAFLLMFNFISASIAAKKKEIGILRAIGARTADVFKIFLSEAMIIALICFAISVLGALGACILLNTTLITDTIIKVSIFVFGPLSVLCIFAIAIVTALISTIIPVGLYSRKPPVASIRAL